MAEEKDQGCGSYGYTAAVRISFLFGIVSRRAAYVRNPPGGREQAAVYFFSPHDAGSGLGKVSESTGHCALLFPFTVTSRRSRDVRINQRIDSLPCPALFSMFPGRLARFLRGRGFHQTTNDRPGQAPTTFGLCGRWRKGREVRSGK